MADMNSILIKEAKGANASVAMVGARKLKFSKAVVEYLGLTKDDIGRESKGKNGLSMGINVKNKELVIFKNLKSKARLVGGSLEHPEVYCSNVCKAMLELMGKELVKEGTVNFTEVKEDTFDHDGTKCIVVDLTQFAANEGVFIEDDMIEEVE